MNKDRGQSKERRPAKVTHWLLAPRGHLHSKEMISIRWWATVNQQTVEPIICTSYKSWRRNRQQVRQCQAARQLNPHRGDVFSSCWPQTLWFYSMSDPAQLQYYFYGRDAFKAAAAIESLAWKLPPQQPGVQQDQSSFLTLNDFSST